MIPTIAVLTVVVLTLALGTLGLRFARTTSNFFVASRSVHPVWNAFAVSGDCLLYTSPSPRDATLSRMPSSA